MEKNYEEIYKKLSSGKYMAVPSWLGVLSYVNPVLIISFVFYVGQKTQDYDSRMFETSRQREEVLWHTQDKNTHMPFNEKVTYFVPRTEVEYKLVTLQRNQELIMQKLNIN